MEIIAKGIYKWSVGNCEEFTPQTFRVYPMNQKAIEEVPISKIQFFTEEDFHVKTTKQGLLISHVLDTTEDIYGFGLQLKSGKAIFRLMCLALNQNGSHTVIPVLLIGQICFQITRR